MATVTVLIPFYNRKNLIKDAVESVFKQTYKSWKLILVDDGSIDNGTSKIKYYLNNPKVKLIKNKKNIGKPKSLNKALRMVDTPYVLELDSDDLLLPFSLEILVNEAEQQSKDVGVVSGNMIYTRITPKKQVKYKRIIKGRQYNDIYEFLLANRVLWPRFYRTSALKDIGGWPTDDPYGGNHGVDDLRVLLRLMEKYKFKWIDKELINIRMHKTNISYKRKRMAEVKEWVIKDSLKRLGDKYEPVFVTDKEGWKFVTELKPKNQNKGISS